MEATVSISGPTGAYTSHLPPCALLQTWTLLRVMQNLLMVKTWPAVHRVNNCCLLLQCDLEKKASYSSSLRTCFPRLSPAQLPSLTSVCFIGHSWRGFYQTLDFLPFNQAMLQIFFPFKTTVKTSPFKQDTLPLMAGKGPSLAKKTQVFKDPSSKHKSLGSKLLGKYLKPHRSKQANPGQDMQRAGVQETFTCPGLQP